MKPSTFTEHQDGVIQRIRLLILVVVLAAFAAQGRQFAVCSSLFGQPKIPSSNPNVLLVEDSDTGVQTAERTSHSNVSRGYMLTRPCSRKVVNRNRNCNGSKKQGSDVKSGKPGGTSIKELKDKYPLDQNYFETEEAFFFRLKYKISSNFDVQGESEICVKGRLKRCLHFWQEIGANENVLDVIENGYKIPFISTPKPAEFKNNKSALLNHSFVSDSVQELLGTKRVVEVPFIPHVVSPLSVSTNKGKNRLILDLR